MPELSQEKKQINERPCADQHRHKTLDNTVLNIQDLHSTRVVLMGMSSAMDSSWRGGEAEGVERCWEGVMEV